MTMTKCGCRDYGDGSVDPCAAHEWLYRSVECRSCGIRVPEDDILADRLCRRCAEASGIVCCDGCGRLLPRTVATEVKQITNGGRVHTWRYCPPCAREEQAD